MRRHLSPAAILMLLLVSRSGFAQDAPTVPVNRVPGNLFIARGPFTNDLSVVGSDGIFYRVRYETLYPTEPVGPSVVPPPPSSILEAFDLDPNSKRPVDSLAFAGLASQLGIGKDNRLYLVVTVIPEVSIATERTASLVPVPTPQSRLYVIPTPFPPRALGATLESLAVPVELGRSKQCHDRRHAESGYYRASRFRGPRSVLESESGWRPGVSLPVGCRSCVSFPDADEHRRCEPQTRSNQAAPKASDLQ